MGFIGWLLGEEPGLGERIGYAIKNCGIEKGGYGEWLTEYMFGNNNITGYSKSLHNIYIPYRGKTSEIDILLVHEKGLFIVESKNYSGWIFGSEEQRYWTQCLQNKSKNRFYNPIMQNKTHINALSNFLSIDKDKMKSYIVFSDRCELKKVPNGTLEYTIVKRNVLLKNLRKELENKQIIFTKEQVNEIINKLQPLTNVPEELKKQHIENINNKYKK